MKELYRSRAEGIGFSKNGYQAYLHGEKPKILWPTGESLTATEAHHTEVREGGQFKRRLVMFFRRFPD